MLCLLSWLDMYLDEVKAFYSDHSRMLHGGIAIACVGITVLWWMKQRKANKTRKIREGYPRDTVILHDIGRGPYAPSLVPWAVKLETYLRMAKIPYQYECSMEPSSKKKFPWITYNGEDIADSAFIIQFLNKRCDLDLSAWLSAEQHAIAVAFQRMFEENLYWVMVVSRWVHEVDLDFVRKISFPSAKLFPWFFIKVFITPATRKMVWAQGIGRHSQEDVRQIARKDLSALNNYLGKKKFLMGDQPCEEDCAMFGQLSQFCWHLPGSIGVMFKEEFPQLVAYCERMKDTFWPDWQQCITQGGTVVATR